MPDIHNTLQRKKAEYEKALNTFNKQHQRTGSKKLIISALIPIFEKLEGEGLTKYKIENAINILFSQIFDIDEPDFPGEVYFTAYKKYKDLTKDIDP